MLSQFVAQGNKKIPWAGVPGVSQASEVEAPCGPGRGEKWWPWGWEVRAQENKGGAEGRAGGGRDPADSATRCLGRGFHADLEWETRPRCHRGRERVLQNPRAMGNSH